MSSGTKTQKQLDARKRRAAEKAARQAAHQAKILAEQNQKAARGGGKLAPWQKLIYAGHPAIQCGNAGCRECGRC